MLVIHLLWKEKIDAEFQITIPELTYFSFLIVIFLKLYKLQSIETISNTSQRLSSLYLPELNLWVAVKNMKENGGNKGDTCPSFLSKEENTITVMANHVISIFRNLKKR